MIQPTNRVFSTLNISKKKASLYFGAIDDSCQIHLWILSRGKKCTIFHHKLAVSSHIRETADKSWDLAWGSTPMECSAHASDQEGRKKQCSWNPTKTHCVHSEWHDCLLLSLAGNLSWPVTTERHDNTDKSGDLGGLASALVRWHFLSVCEDVFCQRFH